MLPRFKTHTPGCKNRIVPATAVSSWIRCWPTASRAAASASALGQGALTADESPYANERTGRNVVGAACFATDLLGQGQQCGQTRFNLHRTVGSLAVDQADFARVPVNRQLRFELIDEIQCRKCRVALV